MCAFVLNVIIINTFNQTKINLIRNLKSLKNYSISSMNDFNRVSHISGGLLFRLYHCSTFVTCQIIFPPHVMFICQNSVVQSCLLLPVQLNQIWGGFLFGCHIHGNVRIIKLCRILNAIYLSLNVFKQISGLMTGP